MRVCPKCGERLLCTQTRPATQCETWTRRRKICACGFRVTTFEIPKEDLYDSGSESQEESSDDS